MSLHACSLIFHPILKATEWNIYGLFPLSAPKNWKIQIRGSIYVGFSENHYNKENAFHTSTTEVQ